MAEASNWARTYRRQNYLQDWLRENTLKGIADPRKYDEIWQERLAAHKELQYYYNGGNIDDWQYIKRLK